MSLEGPGIVAASMGTMSRRILTILLLLLLAACSYDPAELNPDELRALESPIVNGTVDTGHPSVGMLTTEGYGICTATLVGTRTVVTAAHCVVQEQNAPFTMTPQIGWSRDGVAAAIPAVEVVYHPQYALGVGHDIAVVRLAQEVTDITPTRIAKTAPTPNEAILLVGYGYTWDGASDTFGTKRKAPNTIGQLTAMEMVFYGASGSVGNICSGDSGGPAFATRGGEELLVGIHSWGEGECGVAEHDTRSDIHQGWVAQQAQGNLYDGPPADHQPPQVQIVSPGAQSQVGPSFQVAVTAQDDVKVSRVELFVDGTLLDNRTDAPYTFNVTNLAAGSHNIRAEALDSAGQRASTFVTVQVGTSSQQPDPQQPDPQQPGPTQPSTPDADPQNTLVVGACNMGAPFGSPGGAPWIIIVVGLLVVLRRRDLSTRSRRTPLLAWANAARSGSPPAPRRRRMGCRSAGGRTGSHNVLHRRPYPSVAGRRPARGTAPQTAPHPPPWSCHSRG